jgi:hypothetical protein
MFNSFFNESKNKKGASNYSTRVPWRKWMLHWYDEISWDSSTTCVWFLTKLTAIYKMENAYSPEN